MKKKWITIIALMVGAGVANAAYVTIGNPGNADDTTGYGGVSYEYKISATEVTIAEMQASGAGSGNEGYWNSGDRTAGTGAPASYVTLYEAMKYCNYITSGDVYAGAYVFSGGVYQSTDRSSAISTYETICAVPTEDEWYKAAYYTGSGYSLYADGTGTVPTQGFGATGWNYDFANPFPPTYTRDTALGTTEQNGTVNMMGNIAEWIEDDAGVHRGGGFAAHEDDFDSSGRSPLWVSPSYTDSSIGFRPVEVDVVPEPATAGLLAISGLVIVGYRRIRKSYGH